MEAPFFRLFRSARPFSTLEFMRRVLQAVLAEPSVPEPPVRVPRDWPLVGVCLLAVVIEGVFHQSLLWRPLSVAFGAALVATLLWRRTHPLAVLGLAFGGFSAFNLATLLFADRPVELYSGAFVLLLVYSLFRWGSGRDAVIGLVIMLAGLSMSLLADPPSIGDAVGGAIVMLFPGVLGLSMRYQGTARAQKLVSIKIQEREQLARELHDTVAHHVSAIVVQAQAGRFLANGASLQGASDALEVIEEEASRTLTEMRSMVGALRDTEAALELAPQGGVGDIAAMATEAGAHGTPRVDIELSGDVYDLAPSLDAALYRLAQESLTNVIRHAHGATRVRLSVQADPRTVRFSATDDGPAVSRGTDGLGYGLVGMSERVALLGGTFEAGPGPSLGWRVVAALPRDGRAS